MAKRPIANNKNSIGLKFDNNNVMQITTPSIIPNSPKRNYNFYMNIEKNGNLLIAGGGMVGDRLNYVGTIM